MCERVRRWSRGKRWRRVSLHTSTTCSITRIHTTFALNPGPLHIKPHPSTLIHLSTHVRLFSSSHPFFSSLFLLLLYPSCLPSLGPKLRCSICIYHQPIVIVNYNYYKRLHEIIINSDKMSEKKKP